MNGKKTKTITDEDLQNPEVRRRALEYFMAGFPKRPQRFAIGNIPRSGVVHLDTPCHNWSAGKKDKYGKISITGVNLPYNYQGAAHRLAYMLFIGPADGWLVLHLCQNELCVNPLHLKLGDSKENQLHALLNKQRSPNPHPSHMNDLTTADVKHIRYLRHVHNYPIAAIAEMYDKSTKCISDIVNGKSWKI